MESALAVGAGISDAAQDLLTLFRRGAREGPVPRRLASPVPRIEVGAIEGMTVVLALPDGWCSISMPSAQPSRLR